MKLQRWRVCENKTVRRIAAGGESLPEQDMDGLRVELCIEKCHLRLCGRGLWGAWMKTTYQGRQRDQEKRQNTKERRCLRWLEIHQVGRCGRLRLKKGGT